ncbi:hypothetical protein COV24_02520 [candidate division WWE3 bacterium CG10_big_fil_rev_8_21_14_0_10_32_10]|uniref:Uncharacterized protein n=1 Tax=candidate division WWE3 bacterium CG10_big_fil_rev_8_21_14_0_10_32_10 TaxID=1975090 RepID=A0A2H0RAJ4_UNCKA|nr:MAG: hypothetical protein COV24_02520 [candidate division WWE3 bacterium CG10_big_fil_rev_8_21_14_0_10_32_10]
MEVQSANKQHPVPQNVMDVEFKLIGELTVRQFTYLVAFGLMAFATYKLSLLPPIFRYPLILIQVLIGTGFAFFPLNDITLDKWLVNYIKAIKNPRIRTWKHTTNIPYFFTLNVKDKKQDYVERNTVTNKRKLSIEDLIKSRKEPINFEDESDINAKEEEFMKKLGLTSPAYFEQKVEQKPISVTQTQNNIVDDSIITDYRTTLQTTRLEDEMESKKEYASIALGKQEKPEKQEDLIIKTEPDISEKQEIEETKVTTPEADTEKIQNTQQMETDNKNTKGDRQIKQEYLTHIKELNVLKQKLIEEIERNKYKILEGKEKEIQEVTEDIHKKEIENLKEENESLEERLRRLEQKKPRPVIENADHIQAPTAKELEKDERKNSIFTGFLEKLQQEEEKVTLPPLIKSEEHTDIFKQHEIKQHPTRPKVEKERLREVKKPEIKKVQNAPQQQQPTQVIKEDFKQVQRKAPPAKRVPNSIFDLKKVKNNIILGSSKDKEGNVLDSTVIIIKNEDGEPVRALKTNQLGEFEIATPVENGIYTIEGIRDDFSFKKIKITASGSEIDPVKLMGEKV